MLTDLLSPSIVRFLWLTVQFTRRILIGLPSFYRRLVVEELGCIQNLDCFTILACSVTLRADTESVSWLTVDATYTLKIYRSVVSGDFSDCG